MRISVPYIGFVTGLILAYWATRLIVISSFPPFIDEAVHINFARNILLSGPFAYSDEGRQFILWLYALFGAQANAPYWVARVANLIVLVPGFAALVGTGLLLAGRWGALFVALLFTFNPFHHFFERLALADPVSSAGIMLAIYFAARLSKRASYNDAAMCGFALFLAFGAKVSALPFFAVPVIAVATLRPNRYGIRWGATALLVALGLTGAYAGILYWRGYNAFFHFGSVTDLSRLQIILNNIGIATNVVLEYYGIALTILLFSGLIILALRQRFFVPLVFLLPLMVMLFSPRMDSRYLIAPITILLLGGAIALADLVAQRPMLRIISLMGIILWATGVWLPFAWAAARSPIELALPPNDREYMEAEGTGFGLTDVIAVLNERHPSRVIGILANCLSLRDLAPFPVECPRLNPNGEDAQILSDLLASNRADGVYAVLEAIPYAPAEAPGTLIATIGTKRPRLSIYGLAP